jgi:hypothetical protein
MSQPQISLFIDVTNRKLVRSSTSTVPAIMSAAYQGDTLNLSLRFMEATGSNPPYTDIDYSGAAVTVAVGNTAAKPTVGSFTITDTSANQTTYPLPYNVTASIVQETIQAFLTTNWSTATVYGGTGGPFTITNGINGAQSPLIGTSLTLEPASSVPITSLQDGDTHLPAIQYVQLSVNPIALQDSWTSSFDPDVLTGLLSLDTSSIEALMGNNDSICTTFSIKVVPVSGSPFTVFQNNFTIKNDLILGAPSIPPPNVSYYTTVESDARYKGQGVFVERDSTSSSTQHVTTTDAGDNNILYLISEAADTVNFTFEDGTFDGQTLTYRISTSATPPVTTLTYSDNVAGVADPDTIFGDGALLSFMWDASNTVWLPI